MNRLRVLLASLFVVCSLTSQAERSCCPSSPDIRAIDRTCLPVGPAKSDIDMYRTDIEARYAQVAYIDSFKSTDDCTATLQAMLQDLKAKGQSIGADAVIRVKLVKNDVRGWRENMRTPFWSVEQGKWNEYFFRGIAVLYQEQLTGPPEARGERSLTIVQPTQPLRRTTRRRDSRSGVNIPKSSFSSPIQAPTF